jgi:hypothetical protein
MSTLDERRGEFKEFVWNHAIDEFQLKYDECPPLPQPLVDWLRGLLAPKHIADASAMAAAIRDAVRAKPEYLLRLLQVLGLTRNKIITDLKPAIRSQTLRVATSKAAALFRSSEGARLASEYLAPKVMAVFHGFSEIPSAECLRALNQATWPGYIRQQRAKESGHEAERRMALLLFECGFPFEPEEKLENPKSGDVRINMVSYDLVCPGAESALMRVKSTVHASNPGEYGKEKGLSSIKLARERIDADPDRERITLLALIDGVGCESIKGLLDGVLQTADEFCQFRTMWKAAVIAGAKVGRPVIVALPEAETARFVDFCGRHGAKLVRREAVRDPEEWITAGDALVQVGANKSATPAR